MLGNEVIVRRILWVLSAYGKARSRPDGGCSPRLFRWERLVSTRVAWGRVAAVSSGPDHSASKSQAGSGRSPHGTLTYSLYRCATVARMSRASTIREGIANAYRATAAKRQIGITWNAPSRPGANRSWIVRSGSAKNRSSWSRAYVLTVTRLTFSSRTLRRSRSLSPPKQTDISDKKRSWSLAEARRSEAKKGDSKRVSRFRSRSPHVSF